MSKFKYVTNAWFPGSKVLAGSSGVFVIFAVIHPGYMGMGLLFGMSLVFAKHYLFSSSFKQPEIFNNIKLMFCPKMSFIYCPILLL